MIFPTQKTTIKLINPFWETPMNISSSKSLDLAGKDLRGVLELPNQISTSKKGLTSCFYTVFYLI